MQQAGSVSKIAAVCALTTAAFVGMPAASADDVPLHHVRYTVSSDTPVLAHIYYRQTDPPDWGTYSHDPYVWSPRVEAQLGPGQSPWVLDTMLADPNQWAMVVAQSSTNATARLHTTEVGFHCTLEVDDAVVATNHGPRGALCSIRLW